MEIRPAVEVVPLQQQRMVPKLMAINAVMVLPLAQLEARIEEELHANPALERAENTCPRCGAEMKSPLCHGCGHMLGEPVGEEPSPLARGSEDDFDPMAHLMAEVTLQEYLLLQLGARDIGGRRREAAEYLIGCVDERGYLRANLDEVARRFRISRGTTEELLALIQTFDPTGVAARSVEECLLLQLRALESSETNELAQRIIAEGLLPELGRRQYAKLAQRLGTTPQAARDAHEYIRRHLVPYPADRYEAEREGGGRLRPQEVPRPDVVIVRTPRGYAVEVAGPPTMGLRVNDLYRDLYRRARKSPEEFAGHAREHIRDHVSRAKLFVETVKRRSWTLRSILEAIVQAQREFLDRGVEHLKPMTMAMVAARVGISESTVSRALDGKYVQMPGGRVVSCQIFFDGSLPVKERIRHLVAAEEPDSPLTDHEIATRLRYEGIRIARRTATKYREEIGIPPSAERRARGNVLPRGAVAGSA